MGIKTLMKTAMFMSIVLLPSVCLAVLLGTESACTTKTIIKKIIDQKTLKSANQIVNTTSTTQENIKKTEGQCHLTPELQLRKESLQEKETDLQNWVMIELTSYCGGPCKQCQTNRLTANMTDTRRVPYNFAADRSLPIGTRIYLPKGLGLLDNVRSENRVFVVDDRGGALDTEARRYGIIRLDLRVKDHWQAVKYGRRVVPVIIQK